ncbi:MAG: lyase, partial [Acidimicrobiia bacterium]
MRRSPALALVVATVVTTVLAGAGCADGDTPDRSAADTTAPSTAPEAAADPTVERFAVPAGSGPHDVAPAPDGGVWYTAQRVGALGHLDPATGATRHIPLGPGSAP